MSVFRIEKTRDYTVMSNTHLKERTLSLKAKGLLSQMLSLPENWDYTLTGLTRINRDGKDSIREAVRELERAGYVQRHRLRNEKGQLAGNEYIIYERPVSEKPTLENPTQEDPALGKPALENPTTNKELTRSNTKKSIMKSSNPDLSCPVWDADGTGLDGIREKIMEQISYQELLQTGAVSREQLDEVVDLMTEVQCSCQDSMVIAGAEYPLSLIRDRLDRLQSAHIEYVLDCLKANTTYVHNIKKYMLAALFNAPATMDSYYSTLVNHDLYGDGKRGDQGG